MKFSMVSLNTTENKRMTDKWQAGEFQGLPTIKRRFEYRDENGDFEVLHLEGSLWKYLWFRRYFLDCIDCATSMGWVE